METNKLNKLNVNVTDKKEREIKSVYLRIGRGDGAAAIVLSPQIIKTLTEALTAQTNKGDMVITPLGRSDQGREQAKEIHDFLKLLEDKAD